MRRLLLVFLIALSGAALLGTGYGPGGAGVGGGGGGDLTLCSETAGDFDCPGTGTFSELISTPAAGSPGFVEISEDPDDGANTLTIAISGSGLSANQTCTVDSNGSSGSTCPFATSTLNYAVMALTMNDADDYVTGLELGGYGDLCSAANTPFNCCSGADSGSCGTAIETEVGTAFTINEGDIDAGTPVWDTLTISETGTYEFEISVQIGFTATTGNECIAVELAVDSGTATVTAPYAVVGSGARASALPLRANSSSSHGVVVVTGAPAVLAVYAKSCGSGTGFDGVFPTTNQVGDLDSNANGYHGSFLWIRKIQ